MAKKMPTGPEPHVSTKSKSTGSHLEPPSAAVVMRASGSKDKPADRDIAPKPGIFGADHEQPVMKEVVRKEPPWRKGSPGSSKQEANSAK